MQKALEIRSEKYSQMEIEIQDQSLTTLLLQGEQEKLHQRYRHKYY